MGAQKKVGRKAAAPRWPTTVVCGPGKTTAADTLAKIVVAAARDQTPNLNLIVRLAIECASIEHALRVEANDPKHEEHCIRLREAVEHADQRCWSVVARLLEH
jgi:hypothetical protein